MKRNKGLSIALILLASIPFSVTAQQKSAREFYREAEAARTAGLVYMAIERYKEAVSVNPSYVDALSGLAESFFSIGEYTEALSAVGRARQINRSSFFLVTLEGRILLGLGQFQEAEELFQAVILVEPNNIDALFGLAELDVAEGRPASASLRYLAGLKAQPGNIRALLSLVTLNDATGNHQAAERYVRDALITASGDPLARYVAARHYFLRNDLEEAAHHIALAIQMRPEYTDAVRLSGAISLRTGAYGDAAEQLERLLAGDRDDYLLWYSLGVAYQRLEQTDNSLNALARALNIRSDDEVTRLTLEQLLMSSYPVDSEIRQRYASQRFAAAYAYLDKNFSEAALENFRRGLMLDPRSIQGRIGYASIYKAREHYAKYLSELSVLAELELADRDVEDELEIYESILSESVHKDWAQDQFLLERTRHQLHIFSIASAVNMLHPEADTTLISSLRSLLLRYEDVSVAPTANDEQRVTGFSQAFERARAGNSDYFILLDIKEYEREILLIADVYHSETGTKLYSYKTQNTGNGRVDITLRKFSRALHELLPFRARLIDRRFGTGIIDAGTLNGIEVEQEFLILKKGSVSKSRTDLSFVYGDEDILGTFTVTKVDDLLAEGSVKARGFFDRINLNDTIVASDAAAAAVPEENGQAEDQDTTEPATDGDSPDSIDNDEAANPLYKELLRMP